MKIVHSVLAAALAVSFTGGAYAAVSAEKAAELGKSLTATGAEQAGNAAGTIPEYTGGLAEDFTLPGFTKGQSFRPDPFAADKPRLVITSKNMNEYKDQLTEITKALLTRYPDWRVDVFPTHRSARLPDDLQANTLKNATGTKSVEGGLGVANMYPGIPFPIPGTGHEAMWNHLVRFLGVATQTKFSTWNVDSAGRLTLSTKGVSYQQFPLYYPELRNAIAADNSVQQMIKVYYTGPARRAGEAIMVMDSVQPLVQPRRAWQYLPGQRRVKLAPDVAYDTPNPGTAGASTYDDTFIFNGAMDRFDWKLVGKKEMIVPYNSYKIGFEKEPANYLVPNAVSPDYERWELHRVWVVEATLKPGARHIYHKRTFYLDEDTWVAVASDQYDARLDLYRGGFAHVTPSWDVGAANSSYTFSYDLIAGIYTAQGEFGASGGVNYTEPLGKAKWAPESLAGAGIR